MPLPVRLEDVVEVLEMVLGTDAGEAYVHRKTGEVIGFVHEEFGDTIEVADDAPDWEKEIAADRHRVEADDDFVQLPSKFDIHEYSIMQRFCLDQDDDRTRERLLDAISGRGAFRYFKDTVRRLGIEQDWYRYRDDAIYGIAIDFLKDNEISFVDERPAKADSDAPG